MGNGMSLGLTNGTVNFGMLSYSSNAYMHPSTAYGQPVGSNSGGGTTGISNNKSIGITTDPTKSGLVCNIGSIGIPSLAVGKFYIKF